MLKLLTAGLRDKIFSTSHLYADDCNLDRQIDSPADVSTLWNDLHVYLREKKWKILGTLQ